MAPQRQVLAKMRISKIDRTFNRVFSRNRKRNARKKEVANYENLEVLFYP